MLKILSIELETWIDRIRGGCADSSISDDDKWTECEWKWNNFPYNNLFRLDLKFS